MAEKEKEKEESLHRCWLRPARCLSRPSPGRKKAPALKRTPDNAIRARRAGKRLIHGRTADVAAAAMTALAEVAPVTTATTTAAASATTAAATMFAALAFAAAVFAPVVTAAMLTLGLVVTAALMAAATTTAAMATMLAIVTLAAVTVFAVARLRRSRSRGGRKAEKIFQPREESAAAGAGGFAGFVGQFWLLDDRRARGQWAVLGALVTELGRNRHFLARGALRATTVGGAIIALRAVRARLTLLARFASFARFAGRTETIALPRLGGS